MANPMSDGGIILHITDGDANWEVKHKTMTDRVNFSGSIESYQFEYKISYK